MFIQRLETKDLKEFFRANKLYMHLAGSEKEEHLYVSVDPYSRTINMRMYDFDTTYKNPAQWRKFLYNKFGEEYLTAYSEYLESFKKERLDELLKK